ncbi:accessory Sec system S-layer assembly protein [Alkalibacillus flavidus]|uniref:Accessory Sec system S-layer assembly protein n=1 Tax=Alkalibacillus flavidus TaxID=546021 RepID=A0ABV2KV65_9BACI
MNPFKHLGRKAKGQNTTVDADQVLTDVDDQQTEHEVHPELSLHPQWTVEEEDRYVYQFQNNDLEPLKPNQLSLAGFELNVTDKKTVEVGAFVRHSLAKGITLEQASIILLDQDGNKLAKKQFDLSNLGKLPAKSSRPWLFEFGQNDLYVGLDDLPSENFQLAFELKKKHQLDLAESWEQSLATRDKDKLKEITQSLEPPKPGEVNFMGLEAKHKDDGTLQVTMLIRNGSDKSLNLEQVPLVVEDATGDVIAKGGFKLDNFQVQANTSKPWNFIFPSDLITKDEPDLSKWKAYPPQNQ